MAEPSFAINDKLKINTATTNDKAYTLITGFSTKGGKTTSNEGWKLPLPNALDYNSDFQWSAEDMHHIAKDILNASQAMLHGNTNMDELRKGLEAYMPNLQGADPQSIFRNSDLGKGGEILKQKALKAAFDKLNGTRAGQLVENPTGMLKEWNKGNGQAYNPNQQLYFDGVQLREFNMSFTLTPVSASDAKAMREGLLDLISTSSPDLAVGGAYFTYPSYYNISVMIGSVALLKRSNVAITSINCNLSPDGPITWHSDGLPVSIDLEIAFKETQVPTKERLKDITLLGTGISERGGWA